ncbi:putative 10TM putative phosphate transporter, cytosolic domain-containing protein [Medicago truncatula]|uniref:Putative 10TM putative phosphate transporter, cytosolic domain-containing protein n=1 Tax=Medicago truncatula TaxID=3880 RepID=A0A396J129_MEDTR|nr:putative 10TM putative phosphate transporter, cytosolic domain-containing protein [Medicago truncatula]
MEYKSITNLRLAHFTELPPKPSHFTILVRGIPWSSEESYCEAVRKFFTFYHASTYLSHQIVYKSGSVQKLKVCLLSLNIFISIETTFYLMLSLF